MFFVLLMEENLGMRLHGLDGGVFEGGWEGGMVGGYDGGWEGWRLVCLMDGRYSNSLGL